MGSDQKLIKLYLYICQQYREYLVTECHRISNNFNPTFTDEEVLTIYLFGILERRWTVKDIYDEIVKHWSAWFPALPSYPAFVMRLNFVSQGFPMLIERLHADFPPPDLNMTVQMMDSMPIMMTNEARSSFGKVAPELAAKGYCASKKMYYYGVKLHVIGFQHPGTIPFPNFAQLTSGADNDLTAFRCVSPFVSDCELYGDKIYADAEFQADLARRQGVTLLTPIKKQRNEPNQPLFDRLLSTAVSQVRQPIESFFNWLEEHTHIQQASKVRSRKGLFVHVFGRLTAGLLILLGFNS
jgi:Transposase DDE domain